MTRKEEHQNQSEETFRFNRGFRKAVIIFAVVEFFVIALVLGFYMTRR